MKKISKISLLFSIFFILCGFKHTTIIDIKKDNSVNIEVDLLVKDAAIYDEEYNYLSDNIKSFENNGFKASSYNKDGYKGYKLTKKIDNIEESSKNKNEEVSIGNLLEKNFFINGLFRLDKNIFISTYSANYNYEFNRSKFLGNNFSLLPDEVVVTDKVANDEDISSMSDLYDNTLEYELSLIIKLPYKVKSSNASTTSSDGKTLTWVFAPEEVSHINYSFEIINKTNIMIISVTAFVLLVGLFIVLIVLRKKKSTKETLICTSFDPSIAGTISETTLENIPKANKSLEIKEENKS